VQLHKAGVRAGIHHNVDTLFDNGATNSCGPFHPYTRCRCKCL
jgi:hypothetical protein